MICETTHIGQLPLWMICTTTHIGQFVLLRDTLVTSRHIVAMRIKGQFGNKQVESFEEYSRTPDQRTLWEQYKFSCCVLCREGVLFSEVQNVLKL